MLWLLLCALLAFSPWSSWGHQLKWFCCRWPHHEAHWGGKRFTAQRNKWRIENIKHIHGSILYFSTMLLLLFLPEQMQMQNQWLTFTAENYHLCLHILIYFLIYLSTLVCVTKCVWFLPMFEITFLVKPAVFTPFLLGLMLNWVCEMKIPVWNL